MKAPAFWWSEPGLAAASLAPAATLYGAVAARRMGRPGQRAAVPVICLGNFTVGGSGKTPAAMAVAAALRRAGRNPAFLTRGHGGRERGPVLADPTHHAYPAIGDEALLLARDGPTVVSRDRPAGARLAVAGGADVIVMDDGLQNASLAKALAVAVFDGAVGIGNGRVLPAGPLRAPLAAQWPLVQAVLVVGDGAAASGIGREAERRGLPVLRARLVPADAGLQGARVLAFAGIGRPTKMFDTLAELGAEIVSTRAFPDHHPYRRAEISALLDEAERLGAVPVTTEKDAVRLRGLHADEPRLRLVRQLPVRLRFEDEPALEVLLAGALARG